MSLQLKNLQWLPVLFRVKAKALLVAHKVLYSLGLITSLILSFMILLSLTALWPYWPPCFLKQTRHATASGSLHWLFPLPRTLCSFRFPSASLPLLGSPLKWHFSIEAFTNSFKGYVSICENPASCRLRIFAFFYSYIIFQHFFFYHKLFGTLYPPSLFFFLALI